MNTITLMNNTRWLLLVPLLISSLCLAASVFVNFKASGVNTEMLRPEKFLKWHQEQMKSDDPQSLKRHSEKLWMELGNADERSLQAFGVVAKGVTAIVWVSAGNLIFCLMAFFASKSRNTNPTLLSA